MADLPPAKGADGSEGTPVLLPAAPPGLVTGSTTTPERLCWPLALITALIAHAIVLYALARGPSDAMAGGGGQQLDAISVTIVSSQVLESRDQTLAHPTAPAAAGTVQASDGAPDSNPSPDEQRETANADTEPPEQAPSEEPSRNADAVLKPTHPKPRPQSARPPASAAGGDSARGNAASSVKPTGAAAASAGAVRAYARYVSQALAKTKPKGAGDRGTSKVKFTIDAGGHLATAEITATSGSRRLDERVLAAVRSAAFPRPPEGMSIRQLTYEVPYHFR